MKHGQLLAITTGERQEHVNSSVETQRENCGVQKARVRQQDTDLRTNTRSRIPETYMST
jgi:hypothetical protein